MERGISSLTPIEGTFLFDADLGTIKGIGGALHAEGNFAGPLELIRTSGRTRTEGFHLSSGGAKFPLLVDYDAIVDGTNGDTILERVDARLGTSSISAKGAIVKVEGTKGRRITLDTKTRGGRLEDFVKLATRVTSSPLTGIVNVDARLDIPPGEADVSDRMNIDGTFNVADGTVHQSDDSESCGPARASRAGPADGRNHRRRRVQFPRRVSPSTRDGCICGR